MCKIRQVAADHADGVLLSAGALHDCVLEVIEEGGEHRFVRNGLACYDAKRVEALHVEVLALDVEFLEGFLAAGVRGEEVYRVLVYLAGAHPGRFSDRFLIRTAKERLEAVLLKKRHCYLVKGLHLYFLKLREEDLAVVSQHAGEEADLAGLLGRYEVAPHVRGGGEGLELREAVHEAVRERAVGESDIGEAGGPDGDALGLREDEVLHDALGCAHDVHRVGGFVRRDAEVPLGRAVGELLKQSSRAEDIVVEERLDGVDVLLRADVLVGREVADDIEAFVRREHLPERLRGVVHGIRAVVRGYREASGSDVPCELRECVLVGVRDDERRGVER